MVFSGFSGLYIGGRDMICWRFKESNCCSTLSGGFSISQLKSLKRESSDLVMGPKALLKAARVHARAAGRR